MDKKEYWEEEEEEKYEDWEQKLIDDAINPEEAAFMIGYHEE